MLISLDCETTGVDFAHGAKPFLVTTCDDGGLVRFWEWDVDPLTRIPVVPPEDVAEIIELIDAADLIYLHNSKFDWRALDAIGIYLPWEKVRDSLIMGHLLASNHKHDLTWSCIEYLGVDIEPYEVKVREVTKACRSIVKRDHPNWRVADEGNPGMPSVKSGSKRDEDKPWKNDMWLARAYAKAHGGTGTWTDDERFGHKWTTACSEYANTDSSVTLPLGLEMERLIRERGYWKIYEQRLRLMQVDCEMECYGLTARGQYTAATIAEYELHAAETKAELVAIAKEYGHDLQLAEGAALNDNMRDFFYGSVQQSCPQCSYTRRVKHWNGEVANGAVCPKCARPSRRGMGVDRQLVTARRENLGLEVIRTARSGADRHQTSGACLDKNTMETYLHTLDEGPALDFIRLLVDGRKHGTDLTYMKSYRRYWLPVPECPGYFRIHSFFNPCATDHLRHGSNSPNLQNVSVQEEECATCEGDGCSACGGTGKSRLSVRACYGPLPGREWWDMDFNNLEKRIPGYEAEEPALIEIFEKPDDPPYWGSDHNLIASLLFPDEFWPIAEIKGEFKRLHPMEMKRAKNVNFAKQYGAGKRKVDATARVVNAFEKIERGLPELAKLQAHYLALAERTGLVHTLPDRTVDPERGYPLLASRTEDGRVLSTTPFNYHVSGTACDAKNKAMVRCADRCREWRAQGFDAWLALEVHDSLLFDFPRGATPQENLPRALVLKKLMEQSGEDLIPRIPTPVSVEYITESWADGVVVSVN